MKKETHTDLKIPHKAVVLAVVIILLLRCQSSSSSGSSSRTTNTSGSVQYRTVSLKVAVVVVSSRSTYSEPDGSVRSHCARARRRGKGADCGI